MVRLGSFVGLLMSLLCFSPVARSAAAIQAADPASSWLRSEISGHHVMLVQACAATDRQQCGINETQCETQCQGLTNLFDRAGSDARIAACVSQCRGDFRDCMATAGCQLN